MTSLGENLLKPGAARGAFAQVLVHSRGGHGLSLAIESGRQRLAGHFAIHAFIVAQ